VASTGGGTTVRLPVPGCECVDIARRQAEHFQNVTWPPSSVLSGMSSWDCCNCGAGRVQGQDSTAAVNQMRRKRPNDSEKYHIAVKQPLNSLQNLYPASAGDLRSACFASGAKIIATFATG